MPKLQPQPLRGPLRKALLVTVSLSLSLSPLHPVLAADAAARNVKVKAQVQIPPQLA